MKRILLGIAAALLLTSFACKEKGPMEKAGEKVDEAAKDTERKVEDALD